MKVTFKSSAKPEVPFLLVLSPSRTWDHVGLRGGGVCVQKLSESQKKNPAGRGGGMK